MTIHSDEDWWKGAVIYQIYPRSYLDTDGDGIGNIAGITKKLDYIAELGVDGIWISPFFKSPMKDFGYDVSDYRDIDPIFGNLENFKELLARAHELNLKIIIDLVLSHTSNEHPWFHDEGKKDWYVWADAKDDGSEPNNWVSVFGGSAWQWDERYNQYYLHNFLPEQPDLNFHNPEVREEILSICKYWLDMGVDGFRLDTVNFYYHDQLLRDNPPRKDGVSYATQLEKDVPYSQQQHIYDKSQPENLEFLAQLRKLTDKYDGRVLIGEIGDDFPYELTQKYTSGNNHLHTCYNTHMMSGTQKDLNNELITVPVNKAFHRNDSDESANQSVGWPSWAFSNHDVVRAVSRWHRPYEADPDFAKLLIALLGCLPGTIFIYQGEELGLPEAKIPHKFIHDPWAKETWPEWQGRDGCRTPMIWDNSIFCGFSDSNTWLPIPSSHKTLSVETQKGDNSSVLAFTKTFLHWRKNQTHITQGDYIITTESPAEVIEIKRFNDTDETTCIFNLSDKKMSYKGKVLDRFCYSIDGFEE